MLNLPNGQYEKLKLDFRAYFKGKKEDPPVYQAPARPSNSIMFGNNAVAQSKWDGSNFIPQWNPTTQEQSTYDMAQSKLPSLFDKATTSQDFGSYADAVTKNQLDSYNRDAYTGMNKLKNQLSTTGQIGSSIGVDKLKAFNEPYLQGIQDINAKTPMLASDLRTAEQAYNTGLYNNALNNISNYYNTGNSFVNQLQGLDSYAQGVNNQQAQIDYANKYNEWAKKDPEHPYLDSWYGNFIDPLNLMQAETWGGNDKNYINPMSGQMTTQYIPGLGTQLIPLAATAAGLYFGGPAGGYMANQLVNNGNSNPVQQALLSYQAKQAAKGVNG